MSIGRSLPGALLLAAACVLLALVSFNTPLLKQFYFLEGRFSSGDYAGSIRLGTLGYCLQQSGLERCVGPQVGYNFDLNTILNISSDTFQIPTAVSKYLTYVLILHIISLGIAAIALVLVLLEMIPGCYLMCFPTCTASIAGSIAFIAFVFDLAIFFIARASINRVSGAQASVGAAVWMTLAAWLCCAFSVCAIGLGNCCCGCRDDRRGRDRDRDRRRNDDRDAYRDETLRLDAIRDENRRQKEQGLPSFPNYERMPLTDDHEDKYLYDDATPTLARNASTVTGVGVGYGRRAPGPAAAYAGGYLAAGGPPQRRPSVQSSIVGFGQAGVGAGGSGIDQPGHNYDNYDQGGYDELGGYREPIGQAGYNQQGMERVAEEHNYYDPYQNQNAPPQAAGGYDPYAQASNTYPPVPPPAAAAVAHQARGQQQEYYHNGPLSSDSHYQDPGPRVQHAQADPYYEDDGLGAIGRAAQSPTGERQYTGQQGYSAPAIAPLAIPTPQRLLQPQSRGLTSPESEYPSEQSMYDRGQSQYTYDADTGASEPRPPSYGAVASPAEVTSGNRYAAAAPSAYPPEKGR